MAAAGEHVDTTRVTCSPRRADANLRPFSATPGLRLFFDDNRPATSREKQYSVAH